MGVIKDGTVSGTLPEAEAFAVHYPGYPSSTSRAIETLGGLEEIVKRRSAKDERLELRFRPEDPYCHPTFGDLRPSTGLLLKLGKIKGQSECSTSTSVSPPEQLTADVVARVHQAYHFNRMVDYQYVLAVHAAKDPKRKRSWADAGGQLDTGFADIEQDDLMMLVPPLFSLKDVPEDILFKPSSAVMSKDLQKGVVEQRWEMDIEPCLALPFEIEKVPGKVNWEDHIPENSYDWECQVAVSRLFDERPVWPKASLWERLVCDGVPVRENQMRRLLARSGYYFSTGPFAKFWIRKGYDPRADPESRIYQRVDFRIPESVRKAVGAFLARDGSKVNWKELCRFQAFPTKAFTNFQFFELEDEFIQQEIRKPTRKKTCSHLTGWISRCMHEILITHVRVRFLSLLDNDVAKDVVKTSKQHLEKAKKLIIFGNGDIDDEEDITENSRHESDVHGSQSLETESCNLQHNNNGDQPGNFETDIDDEEDITENSRHESDVHGSQSLETESCNLQHNNNGDQPGNFETDSEDEEEDETEEYVLPSADGNNDFLQSHSMNSGDISGDFLRDMLFGLQSQEGYGCDPEGGQTDDEYEIYEQVSENDDDDFEL